MTESETTALIPGQQFQLHTEYAGSIFLRMVFSPLGPDATADDPVQVLAHGSAFVYESDGQTYLVTARHNLTGGTVDLSVFPA